MTQKKLLISAFGVHTGGGFVLLNSLLKNIGDHLDFANLDIRSKDVFVHNIDKNKITYVKKTIFARLLASFNISRKATQNNVLLCFNSLPPVLKCNSTVIVYVHAPHFANLHSGISYSLITKTRISLEKIWFNMFVHNIDKIWVQTPTMQREMKKMYPNSRISVVTFVDDLLIEINSSPTVSESKPHSHYNELYFFYPADTVAHKNHRNLISAWYMLADLGFYPQLSLTITLSEFNELAHNKYQLKNIELLGRINREDVILKFTKSSALVFPSLAETLGIPLIEARKLNVPIISAERDFVRDVCSPVESFDPESPVSICNAILRFMKVNSQFVSLINSQKFINLVLTDHSCDDSTKVL